MSFQPLRILGVITHETILMYDRTIRNECFKCGFMEICNMLNILLGYV